MPSAEGDVPPPEGESDPFPAEPGDAPPPADPSDTPAPEDGEPATDDPADEEESAVSPLARPTEELYDEGQLRFAALEFEVAAGYFEEVLRREPDHTNARNFLVECLIALERQDDAVAVREGANPPGEPTPVAGAEPTEDEPSSRNPRGDRKFSFGLGLGGPSVGLGAWAELRPFWGLAISGGAGVLVVGEDAQAAGIAAVGMGVDLLPVPYRLTPVLGVGLSAVFGDAVWRLDPVTKPLASGADVRLLPHINVGLRLDVDRLQLQAGIWLLPTGNAKLPILPFPGLRLGLHF